MSADLDVRDPAEVDDRPDPPVETGSWPPRRGLLIGLAVAAAGIVARWFVLRSPEGRFHADEAYFGLQAVEITQFDFPMVMGGQTYLFPLEAYAFAPYVAVFGSSVLALKLFHTVWYVALCLLVGATTLRIAGRRAALIAVSVTWIAPAAMASLSVRAYAAYPSGAITVVLALLLASQALDAPELDRRRLLLVGVLAGFGVWLHPMFAAALAPIVVYTAVATRRLIATALLAAGALIGAGPFILWNALNGWPTLSDRGDFGSYSDRLTTYVRDLGPRTFGLRDEFLDWYLPTPLAIVAWLSIVAAIVAGALIAARRTTGPSRWLLATVVFAVYPLMGLFSQLWYANDARYGIISFPIFAIAIAVAADEVVRRWSGASWRLVIPVALVLAWVAVVIVPNYARLVDQPLANPYADLEATAERIVDADLDGVYGLYWLLYPVAYVADDQLEYGLSPGYPNRLPGSQRDFEQLPPERYAMVFEPPFDDPSLLPLDRERYERVEFDTVVVYLPLATDP